MSRRVDLDRAVSRATLEGHDGRSGARIERVVLDDGTRLVVKQAHPDEDLWALATGSADNRELELFEAGILDRLPPGVGHTVLDGWIDDDGLLTTVMRDVGDAVIGWDRKLSRAEFRHLLTAVTSLHRAFRGEAIAAACPLEQRLLVLTPAILAAIPDPAPDSMPAVVKRGWDRLYELVPPDIATALDAVIADPSILADPLRGNGTTLLHGDFWLVNTALEGDDVVLLDWALATDGPPACEMVIFLTGNASQVDASHEEILDDFRELAADLHDEGVLTAALFYGLVELGWNKALDATEHDDPAERARHRADLDWWIRAGQRTLDAGIL